MASLFLLGCKRARRIVAASEPRVVFQRDEGVFYSSLHLESMAFQQIRLPHALNEWCCSTAAAVSRMRVRMNVLRDHRSCFRNEDRAEVHPALFLDELDNFVYCWKHRILKLSAAGSIAAAL